MTRIDFYILTGDAHASREQFACRLIEKVYLLGQGVYIHTENPQQSAMLDKLLWSYRQSSFVPHAVEGETPDPAVAVLIGHTADIQNHDPAQNRELLINLAPDIPLFFSSFQRVAEIVDSQEEHKNRGREHYRFYRDRGYTLENHNIRQ